MRVLLLLLSLSSTAATCNTVNGLNQNYTTNTKRIQDALNQPSPCVIVPAGDYPVKMIKVKSDTRLILSEGARLINIINITLVSIVQVGPNANNVQIEGPGTLYGSSDLGWDYYSAYDNRFSPYNDDGSSPRTHCLYILNSNNITVTKGLKLHNATDWTFRMDNSSNILVDDVDIFGDSRFPNNDGFDPQSCVNVSLTNSRIDVADDGICPKADSRMGPLTNLYVHNVSIRSKSHAIKFGSNTDTEMSNIVFDNITIWDSNGGLSIQARSGGNHSIENVTWSNIKIETRYQAARWWGNGEWLSISNNPRDEPELPSKIHNMKFVNISGRSENGGLLSGLSKGIRDISFENISITIASWSNYSSGPQPCCATDKVCVGKKCYAHPVLTGTVIPCMGTRDYRPTPAPPANSSLHNCPRGHDRVPAKADGIYLENAHNISFSNVIFEYELPRKDYYGTCIQMDQWSTNVSGVDDITCINGQTIQDHQNSISTLITIDASLGIVQKVDEKFISFTIDSGDIPYKKCDLESKEMITLTKAIGPSYLRLSGGAADGLRYEPTTPTSPSPPLPSTTQTHWHAQQQQQDITTTTTVQKCIGGDCGNCDLSNANQQPKNVPISPPSGDAVTFNVSTWRRINTFAAATNNAIIFGLNSKARESTDSPWDGRYGFSTLIEWTHQQPYQEFPVVGYELGNEPDLFCRGNTTISPHRMMLDFVALRHRLDTLPSKVDRDARYLLLGPDTAGIGIVTGSCTGNPNAIYNHFFQQFISNLTAHGSIDILDEITFHQYYFKGPIGHANQFINVSILDSLRNKITLAVGHGLTSLGETSSAYDGGTPGISSSFASTFGWLDKLGLSARFGLSRVFRQQLCCGSSYDLLTKGGTEPRSDYWATLLWKKLMSGKVLTVQGDDRLGRKVRSYVQCAAGTSGGGAVTVVIVNMQQNELASIDFETMHLGPKGVTRVSGTREVYVLATKEGVFTGNQTTLNGNELIFNGTLPFLNPKIETMEHPFVLQPLTVAFVTLRNANVSVCL